MDTSFPITPDAIDAFAHIMARKTRPAHRDAINAASPVYLEWLEGDHLENTAENLADFKHDFCVRCDECGEVFHISDCTSTPDGWVHNDFAHLYVKPYGDDSAWDGCDD